MINQGLVDFCAAQVLRGYGNLVLVKKKYTWEEAISKRFQRSKNINLYDDDIQLIKSRINKMIEEKQKASQIKEKQKLLYPETECHQAKPIPGGARRVIKKGDPFS